VSPNSPSTLYIEQTPSDGTLIEDFPWWTRGYRFTASVDIPMIAFEWKLTLPDDNFIAARLYDSVGTLLASGPAVWGDGTEQWYRSNIPYDLVAGQEYTLAFYIDDPFNGKMPYKDSPTQPFDIAPYMTNVSNRSGDGDVWPTNTNSWAPFMRIVAEESGVVGDCPLGQIEHDNGAGLAEWYCYLPNDSDVARALKACESHFGVGNCCVITGGYNYQQYGECGGGSGAGTIHWHWDDHPEPHCAPWYVVGDVVSPGWCDGSILGNFLGNVGFSGYFFNDEVPTAEVCTAWGDFRSQLTGTYSRITIRGDTYDPVGVSCSGYNADTLCQALYNGATVSVDCDGRTWYIGDCTGVLEISLDGACFCASPGYAVRPCVDHTDWGGVNTDTCDGPDQTMTVICE
jgi:hypothetical protein